MEGCSICIACGFHFHGNVRNRCSILHDICGLLHSDSKLPLTCELIIIENAKSIFFIFSLIASVHVGFNVAP
jgi:hypothetical protein